MKFMTSVFILTSLSIIISCSDSDSPNRETTETPGEGSTTAPMPIPPDEELSLPEALFGVWTTGCESEGDGFANELTEWSFSSTEINITAFTHDPADVTCTDASERLEFTYEANYLSEFVDTQLGSAIATDMIVTKFAAFDESGNIGFDSDVDGIPADVSNQFQIFLVDSDQFFGGDLSTGDATSPENRPTEIDTEDGLGRDQ